MAQNQQINGFIFREIDLAHLVANGENLETFAALLATCSDISVLSLGLAVDISVISHSLLRRLHIGNLIIGRKRSYKSTMHLRTLWMQSERSLVLTKDLVTWTTTRIKVPGDLDVITARAGSTSTEDDYNMFIDCIKP